MELNIILHEPEIPPNTGNIARTCAAIGARLHLIEPLGFRIDEATIQRAGLDYWDKVEVLTYPDLDAFFERTGIVPSMVWYASTKGSRNYSQVAYESPVWLMFGKESKGLPESLLKDNRERCIRLPMREGIRSLNLSNTVAVCAFEVLRQWDYPMLQSRGMLPE